MKKRIKDILIGFIIGSLLVTTTPVLANTILQQINVVLNSVNVEINGEKLDSSSILYNGTTYLPLRKIAEAVGKDVEWEQSTMTANIVEKGDIKLNNETSVVENTDLETSDGIIIRVIKNNKYINLEDCYKKYNNEESKKIKVLTPDGKIITNFNETISLFINDTLVLESIEHISLGKFQVYVEVDYYENTILPLIK